MTRDQMKALLPDGTDDAVVTALLDAMHAEITPFKDAAKKATDELAAKAAEMAEVSRTAATAREKAQAYEALQARYEKDIAEANARAGQIAFDGAIDLGLKLFLGVCLGLSCGLLRGLRAILSGLIGSRFSAISKKLNIHGQSILVRCFFHIIFLLPLNARRQIRE